MRQRTIRALEMFLKRERPLVIRPSSILARRSRLRMKERLSRASFERGENVQ